MEKDILQENHVYLFSMYLYKYRPIKYSQNNSTIYFRLRVNTRMDPGSILQ